MAVEEAAVEAVAVEATGSSAALQIRVPVKGGTSFDWRLALSTGRVRAGTDVLACSSWLNTQKWRLHQA